MKKSKSIITVILMLFFCIFLCACGNENTEDPRKQVLDMYGAGRYEEAEPMFLALLETDQNDDVITFGHACNLLKLGKTVQARDEFELLDGKVTEAQTSIYIKERLFELYLEEKDFEKAAAMAEELTGIYPSETEKNEYYKLQGALLRAAVCRQQGDDEALLEWLKEITGLKEYAKDEYLEMFNIYKRLDRREDALETAEDIYYYMNGHSDYISDVSEIIVTMLDAASVASHVEGKYDEEFFYKAADEFIALAEDKGVAQEQLLKYQIIVAEKRGKMQTAYKLLGVYLNHLPEDKQAIKERDYLETRLKCNEE